MSNTNSYDLTLHPQGNPPSQGEAALAEHPLRIGRYRIEKVLGKGGFGVVYLAHDDQLQRLVAIKVPHRQLVTQAGTAEAYLIEARTVAQLDHPNIVPVHDVGCTEDIPCYVVSKYIDGTDLATRLRQSRLSLKETAELVATVADALQYAHQQGLVHRDIKPGNILLDKSGRPFVTDFGLALQEQEVDKETCYFGTAAYMSPEQARGEGHRVDGRSDIFSLGVVFYEMMVGHRPFRADSQADVMEQVTRFEPRPPRQYVEHIPRELERICLKALAKRATERYTTAKDMADDLRHFLAEQIVNQQSSLEALEGGSRSSLTVVQPPSTSLASSRPDTASITPTADHRPVKIVPKGLRSFDAHDADFFLELLPGPRDRDGLPDSLRFWKARIEETDADNTFSVGLIYGPSGCGKSSLVKAGLLPRLSADVIPVYIEATPEETETRLLHGLRKRCPALEDNLSLKYTLALLRRGQGIPAGKKVLIVLDQFEQWLHSKNEGEGSDLVQSLRQCDGSKVQCIVMVRDDFWLAVSRFLRELEVRLVEGQNVALADLFDLDHARKVLAAFGRAFGKLPENISEATTEQKEFLKQSVAGLAEEGKVICVRLALFAEMMKGKTWTPSTLKEVGGTKGVGITFLEETFSSSSASPEHRYHQKAARAVLRALLPDSGTDIKGQMKSYDSLLEASAYARRPNEFDDLIRILDREIRLITPTDPQGFASDDDSASRAEVGHKYYQLTHDYLVHSLRDWLTRKQKETRRGRAELKLFDTSVTWIAKPENRFLPSWWENLNIRLFTDKTKWTDSQRKMMSKAGRVHGIRTGFLTLLLVAVALGGFSIRHTILEHQQATLAAGLVQRLLDADTAQVPAIIKETAAYRQWADPLLREENVKAAATSRQKLHASLALLPVDEKQVDYLFGRLLDAQPHEVPAICDVLASHKDALLEKFWAVVETPDKGKESQRLRAAAALAKYDPESKKWGKCSTLVVNDLVLENPVYLGRWSEAFRPVRQSLLVPLADIFRTPERTSERTLATNILADYAADQPQVLANLLMDADEKQFAVIYSRFKDHAEQGLPVLMGEIDRKLPPDTTDDAKETLAKRQANAAVTLLRLKRPEKAWPLLKHSPDPRVRSYLIDRLSPLGADAQAIIQRLAEEPDTTIRRALILSLGEFSEQAISLDGRQALLPNLQSHYRTDADPGLHAAAEWLLRKWKQEAWLKAVNDEWAGGKVADGAWRVERNGKLVPPPAARQPSPGWYVNGQGHTMVLIPGPVEFIMGSPPRFIRPMDVESQHRRRIARTFAIAAKSVTAEQFRQFHDRPNLPVKYTRLPTLPAVPINWYMAAKYCNWLSEKEGIPQDQWVYEVKGDEIKSKSNYLSLTGYRLPTEAEREYATRAEAVTSRFFGETDDLLPKYAWYFKNSQESTWPVGSLKPNDLGLFDMHGNVWEWCQDLPRPYPQGAEVFDDVEEAGEVAGTPDRVMRGASFLNLAPEVRSSTRFFIAPATLYGVFCGFRVARTLPPVSQATLSTAPVGGKS